MPDPNLHPRRTKYVPPAAVPDRFGTAVRNPDNNRLIPGKEVNQFGLPMGTRPDAGPSALTSFRAGTGTPGLDSLRALNRPAPVSTPAAPPKVATPARDYGVAGATAALTPTAAFNAQPLTYLPPKPSLSSPAPSPTAAPLPTGAIPATAPRLVYPAIPTHPDDQALLMATRAKDAASRAPEPISIPGGLTGHAMRPGENPLRPGQDSREGNALTAQVNWANGVAPPVLASNPRLDAQPALGTVRYVPKGTPEAAAVVSNTGVARTPAIIAPRPTTPPAMAATPTAGDTGDIDQPESYAKPTVTPSVPPPATPVATAPRAPSLTLPAETTAGTIGQSIRQTAGNRALAITGSVDRNVVKPVVDTYNAAQNFVNGLMGTNVTQAPYTAMPRLKPPSLTQPTDIAKIPGMPGTHPDPLDQAPQIAGPKPRKKATPLDEPANQYN